MARGPAPQDKLVASYGETTAPRDTTPAYGEPRTPFTGPQYVESTGPQRSTPATRSAARSTRPTR
ncbi:hypothetical protein GCM10020220_113360 [Nonomuraea rubra]